jgi:septum site-determining protein MinC
LLVRKRVRSGQVLRHPGHIVVIGDVNPGAQLIAGGDIIVWGKLHGVAHAGALGDASAVICALELMPGLIKIADATRSSSLVSQKRVRVKYPEMAMLELQEIKIISWHEK